VSETLKYVDPYTDDSASDKIDQEIQACQERLKAAPEDAALCYQLATLYVRKGRLADAIPMLEHSLRLNQSNSEGFFLLGNCYIRHDAWEMAARYYLRALKINPDHVPSLYNIGLCYAALDNKVKAVSAFKKFYALETSREWREEAKYQLFKLGVNLQS